MGISIGLVGLGQFGSAFAKLFTSHPLVSRIALCDRNRERLDTWAKRLEPSGKLAANDIHETLEDLLATQLDAVAVITQPWLHAPQCIAAMEAGKHVYSAVPVTHLPDGEEILDWCSRIIDTTRRTGQFYMLGETTFYRPQAMFCRRKAAAGAFGNFVYAEGEYVHDLDDPGCSLRDVRANRLQGDVGREWLPIARQYAEAGKQGGPMHYPTHSVSGPVCVMQTHAVRVTAYGYRNLNQDPHFADEAVSNETALFQMANGATVRICEFREAGAPFHDGETFRIMGTSGSFAENVWKENARTAPFTAKAIPPLKLTAADMRDPLPPDVALAFQRITDPNAVSGSDFTPSGHGGSHPYLVHEFVDAVHSRRLPAIHAWEAARYMAMGVAAHQSVLRDGETLPVPDFGDPPA